MEQQPQQEAPREEYSAPTLVELGPVQDVTLGKYAEDSSDAGRYFS